MTKRKSRSILHGAILLTVLLLSSCHTPDLTYFTDMGARENLEVENVLEVRFRPDDRLMIVVNSRDPQLSALFNLSYNSNTIAGNISNGNTHGNLGYTVDSRGEIDFPVLGKIKVSGFKREDLAAYIKSELMRRNLVNDPVVTVEYAGLSFKVLGEVSRPGRYFFDRDHFTLLDAISMAGDLTINGRRDNISVIRETGGLRTMYKVDLQSGRDLYSSPVYYLQQDDIIYVEATNKRERESTVLGNTLYTPGFWMGLTSFLLSIGLLIFK